MTGERDELEARARALYRAHLTGGLPSPSSAAPLIAALRRRGGAGEAYAALLEAAAPTAAEASDVATWLEATRRRAGPVGDDGVLAFAVARLHGVLRAVGSLDLERVRREATALEHLATEWTGAAQPATVARTWADVLTHGHDHPVTPLDLEAASFEPGPPDADAALATATSGSMSMAAPPSADSAASIVAPLRADRVMLRALDALRRQDLQSAVAAARRASRMARADGVLEREYLANLVLARVRRFMGLGVFAARIARTLAVVVPRAYSPWVEWEAWMAVGEPPTTDRVRAVAALMDDATAAAAANDRATFDRAAAALEAHPIALIRQDVVAYLACLDPARPTGGTLAAPWIEGAVEQPPFSRSSPPSTWTLATPSGPPRRVLHEGLGLVGAPLARVDPETWSGRRRVLEFLGALVQAGTEGLDNDVLFERVWGFPYHRDRHSKVVDQTVLRAREALTVATEGTGITCGLERERGRTRLTHDGPLAIPGPTRPSLKHQLVQSLARRESTVEELAATLDVPRRTLQRMIRELIDEDLCEARKSGRSISYLVEDTTFDAPTLERLAAWRTELPFG